LGWRDQKYIPDSTNYCAYLATQDAFFAQPHSHATLLEGSIVWHLVMQALGHDIILIGPTDDIIEIGHVLRMGQVDLWDDRLLEQELELICGV
jgi:hypothetical protein